MGHISKETVQVQKRLFKIIKAMEGSKFEIVAESEPNE
jgi:hypothetical protein